MRQPNLSDPLLAHSKQISLWWEREKKGEKKSYKGLECIVIKNSLNDLRETKSTKSVEEAEKQLLSTRF